MIFNVRKYLCVNIFIIITRKSSLSGRNNSRRDISMVFDFSTRARREKERAPNVCPLQLKYRKIFIKSAIPKKNQAPAMDLRIFVSLDEPAGIWFTRVWFSSTWGRCNFWYKRGRIFLVVYLVPNWLLAIQLLINFRILACSRYKTIRRENLKFQLRCPSDSITNKPSWRCISKVIVSHHRVLGFIGFHFIFPILPY